MDSKRTNKTIVRTETTTRTLTRELTWSEEMVVRMARGLSEDGAFALERRTSDPELLARLGVLEAQLLAEMHGAGPLAESTQPPNDVKARILDRLSSLDD